MAKQHGIKVGDKVKLTARFLRSTGQRVGGEGASVWTVTAVEGDFVTTSERKHPEDMQYFTPEELAAQPSLAFRRFNAFNLFVVGKIDYTSAD